MSRLEDLDQALENHVISTTMVSDVNECACICYANINCVSLNFNYLAQICELNSSTKQDSQASFIELKDFVYYEMT